MDSPLVRALLFGSLDGLGEERVFLYARTGLIHLFSASGFHMGAALGISAIVSRGALFGVRDTRLRASGACLLALALMSYFGSVTEWSSPMVRAFAFAALRSLAGALEIRASTLRLFLISLAAAALLGRGSALSFLLSAIGMAAILSVQPKRWWTFLLAPWLATLPVTIWVFGLASFSAPLWNLFVGSVVAWTVLPLAIAGLLLNTLGTGSACFAAAAAIMELLDRLLRFGDRSVGGALWVEPFPWSLAAALLVAAWLCRRRTPVAALLILLAFSIPLAWRPPRLALLDVGQGDSIYLRAGGASLLVDAGPPGRRFSAPAGLALERLAIGALDNVLVTHPDLDHRGGLDSLFTRHPVRGALWIREDSLRTKGAMEAAAAAERAGIPVRFLERGAPPGLRCWLADARTTNDLSPLCRAQLDGGRSILLTGDMSAEQERKLLPMLVSADYLKLAHHGSRFSSDPAFLAAAEARVALVSAGRKNRYGHPARDALERARAAGMEIRRTDLEGTIRLE